MQEAALPRVLSAAGWSPELLRLSESTPRADAVAQGAITQAFSCFALRWPHRWVEISCHLFFFSHFSFLGRDYYQVTHSDFSEAIGYWLLTLCQQAIV